MLSITEENYLKAIYQLTIENNNEVSAGTNEIAVYLGVKPATATDMLKKLKEKDYISYEKYGKSSLNQVGKSIAIEIIRKHRLWETFLHQVMEFSWDEVHEVAEQLEHIKSKKLIDSLDKFLNYPKYDPHGDVIPSADGEIAFRHTKTLNNELINHTCEIVGVKDNSSDFLKYIESLDLVLGKIININEIYSFDKSMNISINGINKNISEKLAENIVVSCKNC
jgi:DtxR family Mn-dependent transcriptional regulator